jgi:PadR family transcriptional regulator PadR
LNIKKWKTQLKKGTLRMVVLSFLDEGEEYGFEIMRCLKADYDLDIPEGTLYPILKRLLKDKAVVDKWQTAGSTGHPRRYYYITSEGRRQLREMQKAWGAYVGEIEKMMEQGIDRDSPDLPG